MDVDYYNYFLSIAENHQQLRHSPSESHFSEMEFGQLENDLHRKLHTPLLALGPENYESSGNHVNARWQVRGNLFILEKVKDTEDFAALRAAKVKCRKIAEDIWAKMMKDRKASELNGSGFALPGLSTEGTVIKYLSLEYAPLTGVWMSFSYNHRQDGFSTDTWTNDTDYR